MENLWEMEVLVLYCCRFLAKSYLIPVCSMASYSSPK
jgi:hypothetical protein